VTFYFICQEIKMEKKNFEAFTNLRPLKTNAIQLCGQDFIDGLAEKGIYAKDAEFWREVNKKLNIPDDVSELKQAQEKAEGERKQIEEKAKIQAERERLLANKKELYSKDKQGWKITVFELLESDKHGNKFVAECTKEAELRDTTCFSKSPGESYSRACSFIDEFEKRQDKFKRFIENYQVLKPLYLMLIYLSGWDEYNPYMGNTKNQHSQENFIGVKFWNGFNFEILKQLEAEELLEFSTSRKTLTINKKGIKEARDILKRINLEGVEALLEQRKNHE
jgi:hypothetical protein